MSSDRMEIVLATFTCSSSEGPDLPYFTLSFIDDQVEPNSLVVKNARYVSQETLLSSLGYGRRERSIMNRWR